ncbi:macrolide transport system ATP-binding/permease protein [Stackebrandtia albiflava]|uniref:Macrolide transport system ATP-binding/permease protein n=1 Tax=Stackebrandtia albiflava TaxID=406432 RepID=A0A562VGY3_9ACTN|nr:ABC-F family ATP-binding cassette domain-containing protein [Stackebrandtia albiflava]TWJ17128.1 macrolide transport system ATP-binding/permease protein [Stackebrandtia albiflava]
MNHVLSPTATVSQIALTEVTKSYDGPPVLDRVSLTVPHGEKLAVVGENGSGKSTLLRLLAGTESADGGDITVMAAGGIGHAAQTLLLPDDATVADAIDLAFADLRALERRIGEAERGLADADDDALAEYGDLLTEYEQRGGYRTESRLATAVQALGVAHIGNDRRIGTLSGGEQSRLGLAAVLAADPELILLDEPTNHLDAAAVGWLARRLRDHRGTVVAVTHDRRFLAGFAEAILEVDADRRTVRRYGDGWDGYLSAKAAARRRWEQEYRDWRAEVARQSAATETGASRLASKVRSDTRPRTAGHRRSHETGLSAVVRQAHERLRRLREDPVPEPPEPLRFSGEFAADTVEEAAGPVATLDGVRVGDRLVVDGLRVGGGDRLLVTGPNGAGKTTLLRVLAGDLTPDTGTVTRPEHIGYLRQELPAAPTTRTVTEEFAAGLPGPADAHADRLRSLGLLAEADLDRPVAALSVGQRRRLELAKLVSRPARLLVLDEPTNHLSPALVAELEEALDRFTGALVVVSHDAAFTDVFRGRRLAVSAGRLR